MGRTKFTFSRCYYYFAPAAGLHPLARSRGLLSPTRSTRSTGRLCACAAAGGGGHLRDGVHAFFGQVLSGEKPADVDLFSGGLGGAPDDHVLRRGRSKRVLWDRRCRDEPSRPSRPGLNRFPVHLEGKRSRSLHQQGQYRSHGKHIPGKAITTTFLRRELHGNDIVRRNPAKAMALTLNRRVPMNGRHSAPGKCRRPNRGRGRGDGDGGGRPDRYRRIRRIKRDVGRRRGFPGAFFTTGDRSK